MFNGANLKRKIKKKKAKWISRKFTTANLEACT